MFQCQECKRVFRTVNSAEKAAMDGCPRCGGTDIDLAPYKTEPSNAVLTFAGSRKPDGPDRAA